MRGLMSPFAHVMFTATLGVCVGYAARNGGTLMVLGAWVVGLVPAMFLHGLWNSTSFLGGNFFIVYVVLQVPLFIMFILGIILLRRSEAKLTRKRLSDYVPSGWFTQQEVPMLATGAGPASCPGLGQDVRGRARHEGIHPAGHPPGLHPAAAPGGRQGRPRQCRGTALRH